MALPTKYKKIKLYGEQTVDYLHVITSVEEPTADMLRNNYKPTWGGDTLLLANYDTSISGGNIVSLQESVTNWIVYRQDVGSSTLKYINKIEGKYTELTDYLVSNQNDYKYVIFPETANTIGARMESATVKTKWSNWSITDIIKSDTDDNLYYADKDNIWLFNANVTSGETTQNIDKYKYEGLSQFPKINVGKKNYMSGGISCLIGDVGYDDDGVYRYIDTISQRKRFEAFVANGNHKLIKDRKGNVRVVDIISNSFKIDDVSAIQPTTISFTWVELMSIDSISVVEKNV